MPGIPTFYSNNTFTVAIVYRDDHWFVYRKMPVTRKPSRPTTTHSPWSLCTVKEDLWFLFYKMPVTRTCPRPTTTHSPRSLCIIVKNIAITFELTEGRGKVIRREIELLDLTPTSEVKEVVQEIVKLEPTATRQQPKLEKLVGRIIHILKDSSHTSYTRHRILRAHILPLTNVALNKDASLCATGSYDRECRLWNTNDGKLIATLGGHQDVVFDVMFTGNNSEHLTTCSFDGTIRLYSVDTASCDMVLTGHTGPVIVMSRVRHITPRLVTGGMDTCVRIWDLHMGECVSTLSGHTGAVVSVECDRVGNTLYTASFDASVRIWDTRTYTATGILEAQHEGELNGAKVSWCGQYLASWGTDGIVAVWDLRQQTKPMHILQHDAEVVTGAWDRCGRQLVTGGVDRTANVLHLPSLTHTLSLTQHAGEVSKVCFKPCGTAIITAGQDGYLRVFDATDGHCIQEERGHTGEIYSLALSYGGEVLVTGSNRDSTCVIWKAAKPKESITELK
ncbi:hypothetical protein Pcinc_028883 [Petrolisthes cinctipes]|uniref:Dynein assembly factor with WDR repeat domains 1 n=1 Tax=Petrolisthes cinctipes TaxID=88211 RepID=A0AAE1F1H0_PETCI|nr:hypothetical protein Pcinc_028883 [Petrolisthes cinctipes]